MYSIQKELHFCAAHRLSNHKGKCFFIHGHNYRVIVSVETEMLNKVSGMVMDFSVLKNTLQTYLNDTFDHRLILSESDPLWSYFKAFPEEQVDNILVFPGEPTAENMAKVLFGQFSALIPYNIESVEVYETDGASAVYYQHRGDV
jgi:6-pyruvoyltetrahydropterin/6-carboxytetrahydropterin synthase